MRLTSAQQKKETTSWPSLTPISWATRAATLIAATLRGWVQPICKVAIDTKIFYSPPHYRSGYNYKQKENIRASDIIASLTQTTNTGALTFPTLLYPASWRYWGIWVVFPEPVSPSITSTWKPWCAERQKMIPTRDMTDKTKDFARTNIMLQPWVPILTWCCVIASSSRSLYGKIGNVFRSSCISSRNIAEMLKQSVILRMFRVLQQIHVQYWPPTITSTLIAYKTIQLRFKHRNVNGWVQFMASTNGKELGPEASHMLTLQLIPWPFSLLHHLHYPVQHNSHSLSITMDRTFLGFTDSHL